MLPLFSGGYNSVADIKSFDSDMDLYYANYNQLNSHYIEHNVPNEITSKSTIQKVLDNCFLYGYCGNDYRIAEITFNDGYHLNNDWLNSFNFVFEDVICPPFPEEG